LLKKFYISLFVVLTGSLGLLAQPNKGKDHQLKKMTIEEYVQKYIAIAKEEMRNHRIPASITLAQGILESNFGNSPLATEANNHFGIKCHKNFQGKGYYMTDDAVNECFRVYDKAEDSFHDHSDFLLSRPRYAELFKLDPKDYKAWAKGLQAAGYATNPQYANLIIRIIEERNLHQYDTADPDLMAKLETKEDVIKVFENKVLVFNGLKITVAQPKQTIIDIAEKFRIDYKHLKKFNDIMNDDDTNYYLIPGAKVYLEQKKSTGFGVTHRVNELETMHSIAQKQGIRLADLYKLNLMQPGDEPVVDAELQLRKKAKRAPKLKSDAEKEKLYAKIKRLTSKEEPVKKEQESSVPGLGPTQEPEIEKVVQKEPEKPKKEPEPKKETVPSEPIYHSVEPKQTLYAISLIYNVGVETIKKWNNLKDNSLSTDQQLIVGYTNDKIKSAEDLRVKKPNMNPVYHTVRPRETLISIASWYDVKTDDLKRWNNISSITVQPGTELIVGYVKEGETYKRPNTEEPVETPEVETPKKEEPKKETPKPEVKTDGKKFPKYHFVEAGETMFAISKKFGVTVDQLMQWNGMNSPALERGQKLIVGYTELQEEPKPQVQKQEAPKQPETPKPEPKVETPKPPTASEFHIVQPKETLFSISKQHNITVEELTSWNKIQGTTLSVGQKLIVTKPKQQPAPAAQGSMKYHTVEAGETTFAISKKYGVTVDQIKEWNSLPDYNLKVGQRIIVGK
jgi:LysM repeat protein